VTPNPASTFSFRRRVVRIPNIRLAAIVSLVLHALLFLSAAPELIRLNQPFEVSRETDGKPAGSLAVRLAPPTSRHADETPMIPRAPAMHLPRAVASKPSHAPAPQSPPLLAREKSSTPPAVATPTPAAPGDLAAYIESRRRAREPESVPAAPSQPAETQQERDNRAAADNLGFNRVPTFGAGRRTGGGVFQISTMRYDSAEFFFFGWNKLIRRNAQQMIEVRRGDNASIELAVVRRMIAIIREQTPADFIWESVRQNREVTLSARPADNAGLEEFLMREFFPDYRR
jgi:hypothetical protein